MYRLGKRSRRVFDSGLDKDLKRIIEAQLLASPIDFMLTDGMRTSGEQWELFQIGREHFPNKGDWADPVAWIETGAGVVTYCDGIAKESRHQSGNAIDVCAYIPGRPDLAYDKIHMAVLIGSFLTTSKILHNQGLIERTLRSGADWDRDTQFLEPGTFIDMPHLELI